VSTITVEKFVKRVVTARPQETLAGLAQLMERHNVGAVVILEGHRPVGVVTDRDLALHLGARGASLHLPAAAVMSRPVYTVNCNMGVFDATRAMKKFGVRRLPVVDTEERVVGLVTLDDLLRLLARELVNLADGIQSETEVKGLAEPATESSEGWRLAHLEEQYGEGQAG
jgi:CBS domain-containing protein